MAYGCGLMIKVESIPTAAQASVLRQNVHTVKLLWLFGGLCVNMHWRVTEDVLTGYD